MSRWSKGNLSMFKNASPHMMYRAMKLRENETQAEKVFWQMVKDNKIRGYKFRRQHALAHFVVDFYCHKLKLVIELDGSIHDLREVVENDLQRQKELEMMGISVQRFNNEDVISNQEKVLAELKQIIVRIERKNSK